MIRHHFDLRVSHELGRYMGPIRIYRRTHDQIMASPPANIASNRANVLLADVLQQRFPLLLNNPVALATLANWLGLPHVRDHAEIIGMQNQHVNIPANVNNMTNIAKANLIILL
ncbi:Abhydrolase domain-containing protein 16A, partial [Folsomia candida]